MALDRQLVSMVTGQWAVAHSGFGLYFTGSEREREADEETQDELARSPSLSLSLSLVVHLATPFLVNPGLVCKCVINGLQVASSLSLAGRSHFVRAKKLKIRRPRRQGASLS